MIYRKYRWNQSADKEIKLLKNFFSVHIVEKINLFTEGGELNKQLKDSEILRVYREIADYLKSNNAQAKKLLPKLSAETALCNNFTAALLILFIIHLLRNIYFVEAINLPLIIVWVLTIVSLIYCGQDRYMRLLGSLFAYLRYRIKRK